MHPTPITTRLAAFAAAMFLSISGSHAEITIDSSVTFTSSPNNAIAHLNPFTFSVADLGAFNPGGSDKLILAFSSENANSVTSVTYRGETMEPALFAGGPNRYTGIYYLDNPPEAGGLVITFSNNQANGVGGALLAVSGTEPGFGAISSSATAATSLNTTDANSLVVASTAANDDASPNNINIAPQAPLTTLFSLPVGSAVGAAGYQLVDSASTIISSFSTGEITVAVEFISGIPFDFRLGITPNPTTPGHYDFAWQSRAGKLYDLVSETDLSNPPAEWPVWLELADIEPTGTGANTLTEIPGGDDTRRFFTLIEKNPPVVEVEQVRVFLVGGQSNADGRADPSGLPTEPVNLQLPQEDVDYYYNVLGKIPALTTLRPGLTGRNDGFGPSITLGRSLADALGDGEVTRVAIIKSARGGTTLVNDWKAGGDATTIGDGPDYVAFQQAVSDGLAALAGIYPSADIQIEGMLWVQGESDIASGGAQAWNSYEANLTNFLADIRATYGATMPFIISRLSREQTALNATGLAVVRAAQVKVADDNAFTTWLDTDGVGMSGDAVHFNATGYQKIGNDAAAALLDMIP